MAVRYNPALREEPRNRPITVIPPSTGESLFSWLENTGRFKAYEPSESQDHKVAEELDDILELDNYSLETEEEQFDSEE